MRKWLCLVIFIFMAGCDTNPPLENNASANVNQTHGVSTNQHPLSSVAITESKCQFDSTKFAYVCPSNDPVTQIESNECEKLAEIAICKKNVVIDYYAEALKNIKAKRKVAGYQEYIGYNDTRCVFGYDDTTSKLYKCSADSIAIHIPSNKCIRRGSVYRCDSDSTYDLFADLSDSIATSNRYSGGSAHSAGHDVFVHGYYRGNGTYVHSYTRSAPGRGHK